MSATLTLPDLAVSTFTKGLQTYSKILSKAAEHAKAHNVDVNTYVQARLIDDQLPLAFQVQNASKAVQVNLGRLSGEDPVLFENNETTFEDLQKRVQKTLEYVKAWDVEGVKAQGKEEETIDFPWGGKTHKIARKAAVLGTGLPNFYFHLTTGYSILRAKGVPLGKGDFLGGFLDGFLEL